VKLLLDEMYPAAVAKQLRDRGRDVEAITERAELRALDDNALFALAQQERRAIATENIADFNLSANRSDERGEAHQGLVFIPSGSYPRGNSRTIGRMVTALDRLLAAQSQTTPASPRFWL
jgi:predicted nuclease of predicted toxin-antitoxin system